MTKKSYSSEIYKKIKKSQSYCNGNIPILLFFIKKNEKSPEKAA